MQEDVGPTGANMEAISKYGTTPLIEAVLVSGFESVRVFMELGADVNNIDVYGRTALDYAKNNSLKEFLRKHGAKTGEELKAEKK